MEEMAKSLCSAYLRKELEADLARELDEYLRHDIAWHAVRRKNGNGEIRLDPDGVPEEAVASFRNFLAHKLRRKVG